MICSNLSHDLCVMMQFEQFKDFSHDFWEIFDFVETLQSGLNWEILPCNHSGFVSSDQLTKGSNPADSGETCLAFLHGHRNAGKTCMSLTNFLTINCEITNKIDTVLLNWAWTAWWAGLTQLPWRMLLESVTCVDRCVPQNEEADKFHFCFHHMSKDDSPCSSKSCPPFKEGKSCLLCFQTICEFLVQNKVQSSERKTLQN